MKILVTGGAGFIASQIADAYIEQGHEVTIVDDLSTGKKKNVNPRAQFSQMDIRDPNISTLFAKSGFDIVNHHAAQIDVRRSVQDPFLDASINTLGTLRLLDCCRTYGARKFIFSASGGTYYGECERAAVETDTPRPESPYGFSKLHAETYIRFFGKFYNLPFTVLRYGNIYGPRQDPHGEAGVVSIFIGKLLANEPVTIYGSGKQERDYVFVQDVVAANVAALTQGENGVFNIGTQTPTSVNTLYEKLAKIHGSQSPKPVHAPARAGELERSLLNNQLAQKHLGWRPAHSLDQGLEATYRYFQQQKPAPTLSKKS